jgi:FKBP-type peptidyl-prolyl cis-trans isomerase
MCFGNIGYGLEDDESKPGEKAFSFTVGDSSVIAALNDAIPGMKKGDIRRLSVVVSFVKSI